MSIKKQPHIIEGKRFVDDRGILLSINNLSLETYKRFYVIENHRQNLIRAWHGHLLEEKVLIAIQGTFLVGAVALTSASNPSKEVSVERFVMDASNSQALLIPAGYANGFMSLSISAKILVLSSTTLEESQGDDYRFPYDYWDIWKIENR